MNGVILIKIEFENLGEWNWKFKNTFTITLNDILQNGSLKKTVENIPEFKFEISNSYRSLLNVHTVIKLYKNKVNYDEVKKYNMYNRYVNSVIQDLFCNFDSYTSGAKMIEENLLYKYFRNVVIFIKFIPK